MGFKMTDLEIIKMYETDRIKAMEMVEEKYGKECREYAARYADDDSDVEESIRQMHIVLQQCIPPMEPTDLKAFLIKVLRNTSYNRYKKIRIAKTNQTEIEGILKELSEDFIVSEDINLDEMIAMKDAGYVVKKWLKKMNSDTRDVFIRRFVFIESEKEIAEKYQTTPENIRIILENAKDSLRVAMKKGGF